MTTGLYEMELAGRSFRHKGLEAFFKRGTKAGIQPHHAAKLRLQLNALDADYH